MDEIDKFLKEGGGGCYHYPLVETATQMRGLG